MNRQEETSTGSPGPADLVTAAGIDHVRLVYDYLDAGDLDACASLLHDGVVLELPGLPAFHGRAAVLHTHFGRTLPGARYEIDRVMGQDRGVVATGRRVVPGTDGQDLRFVDVFTIADDGLVLACTRYHHVAP
ncbi:nuclear transport factor 2 family protein [Streptomyces sp. NPDC096079]|uniref:nuclear transport factor 2 family protein n=1 Tax=unclassified Streptomyces TaxID=2593676 RepID=UPI0033339B10